MSPTERIEEAHGLWEIDVTRLAALVEAGASRDKLNAAHKEERASYAWWKAVSREAVASSQFPGVR